MTLVGALGFVTFFFGVLGTAAAISFLVGYEKLTKAKIATTAILGLVCFATALGLALSFNP